MKVFRDFKNKKDLLKELSVYKEIILKKSNIEELNSALNKTRSALTLIKEFQDKFELDDQLNDFNELNNKITTKLKEYRDVYVRRLHNLLKEQVDETSLENLMKLLVMLKTEVDKVYEIYNLQDLQEKINHYFSFIKRLYVILSSYETVNFHDVSENIFNFIKDLEFLAFPNLERLIQVIYQKLVTRRIAELSQRFEKISISELAEKMEMEQEEVMDFVYLIMEQPESPIKVYNSTDQEVIFKQ